LFLVFLIGILYVLNQQDLPIENLIENPLAFKALLEVNLNFRLPDSDLTITGVANCPV